MPRQSPVTKDPADAAPGQDGRTRIRRTPVNVQDALRAAAAAGLSQSSKTPEEWVTYIKEETGEDYTVGHVRSRLIKNYLPPP
jgi:hypothetical protein